MMHVLCFVAAIMVQGLNSGQDPSVHIDLVVDETPRPALYEVSTKVKCGEVDYDIRIESGHAGHSRVAKATADGQDVSLFVGADTLDSLIQTVRVTGVYPTVCGGRNSFLQLSIRTYDATVDALPGHDGEGRLVATAVGP